ncbi:lea domain protein [Diplodia corticola]|uniref:Lea domain protein n=1 Tax=Diplodia corticola TaxID=236234 RepID=A0A1J9RJV4_9PEZI|nr:lea domain protein [Diplodia corticola]OJD32843.1 lea domain protein [Diplodia corticola]
MPSPAAGKGTDAPRTPTKLGRKPAPPKLGEAASEKASEVTSGKPQTENPDLPPRPSEGDISEKVEGAKKTAEDAPQQASGAASEAGEAGEQDPTGKVSEATGDLKEQAPKPVGDDDDDEDDDAARSDDDNATEKAGDLGEEAEDTAEDTAESAQESTADLQERGEQAPKKAGSNVLGNARNLAGRASSLASKSSSQDPSKAVGAAKDTAEDTADDVQDTAEDTTGDVKDTADDTAKGPLDDVQDTAGGAAEDVDETAQGGPVQEAQETAEGLGKEAEGAVGGAKGTAEGAVDDAKDTAEDTTGQEIPDVGDLSVLKGLEVQPDGGVVDSEGNQIGKLVEGDAEDLEGYAIGDNGEILDDDGDLVGRCELLPEKIDAQKRKAQQAAEGAAGGDLPDLSILKGLTVNQVGEIFNDDGDVVGQIVEGDIQQLKGRQVNERGEILDDDGNVIGRAQIHPDFEGAGEALDGYDDEGVDGAATDVAGAAKSATGKVDEAGNKVDEAGNKVDEAGNKVEEAGEAVSGAPSKSGRADSALGGAKSQIESEVPDLPGVEALEGREINSEGEVVDSEGNVLGQLADGVDIGKAKGLTVNEKGEVVDEEGNVLGTVELADGAAEHLQEKLRPLALDIRILEGLKVNKKGKVLNEEGDEIGELTEGDVKKAAGKTINDKGEVLDKDGKLVGKVEIIPGDAAEEATKELRERLTELEGPKEFIPGLDILDGLKVNKKGKVLNEDGEEIGELVQGELSDCAGKKLNDKGEVLDKDGNIIGRVRVLPQQVEEGDVEAEELADAQAAEAAQEGAEDAAEDAEDAAEDAEDAEDAAEDAAEGTETAVDEEGAEEDNLPPLSVLEGLGVNKAGKLINSDGVVVGELIEGDAKKLSKLGATADAEGQFWDNKGKVIGRAKTVPVEDDQEGTFAGLEGLIVVKDGKVEDENGNVVGVVVEGDAKKLVGRAVDEDGDIIDKKGSVIGHAERYEEPEEEVEEEEPIDYSMLIGKTLNKQGNVIGDEGVPIARLVEGNVKELAGRKVSEEGQIWNDAGKVIGRVEIIPENERESKPEGPFAGLDDLRVVADGNVADEDGNIVGHITEGNPKRLIGLSVDEDGDIIDKYGNVKGHAEPLEDEPEEEPADLSILNNKVLNKQGFVVTEDGIPLGKLVEGNVSELAGRRCDENGQIHGDTGKVVGRCELIPENERVAKPEGPFAGLEGLRVVAEGKVEDIDGNVVGELVEGDAKRLVGLKVDEDGDIIDKFGNVKGHAEPWQEEEAQPEDLSALAGCTVNKAGNVVDSAGAIVGRVAEGDPKAMVGRKVDGEGQIWDNAGNVIGRAELVRGVDTTPEGPFSGFDNVTVAKDGTVVTADGSIVGRVIEGDVQKLVGHKVDEEGEIVDKNGNPIGKAERWEPEEKERRINPMSGRRVNREGEVRDEDGNVMGRLTAGDLGHCAGLEIDDNGYVIDNDGNKVGEVTLLENIVEEEEEEEGLTEEELEELRKKKEDAELADKMANICQQTLERVQPVCKQITEYIEAADRTPREELDEEQLVDNVKPLIEEAGRILQECNGSLRGLDPDGRIAAQAKGRAGTREATPEEYRLADCLKELTTTVVTTIDNAKKKIADMPHAKKKLNPLWALLTEPLFQIIAAVGLLLSGVLGLVGRLLNGLGLGGLVNGLLGGLGINKLLNGLGLGSISEALGGKKKEKKKGDGAKGLPLVGGLFGSK